jgi:type IV secretory pathway TrbD component
MGGIFQFLPRNVAQLTGVIVAAIVAFGTDTDLFVAVPLGVFAGALATLFVAMADSRPKLRARPQQDAAYRRRMERYRR